MTRRAALGWLSLAAFGLVAATGPIAGPSGLDSTRTLAVAALAAAVGLVVGRLAREARPAIVIAIAIAAGALAGLLGLLIGRELATTVFGPGREALYGIVIAAAAGLLAIGIGLTGRSRTRDAADWLESLPRGILPSVALAAFLVIDLLEVSRGDALRDLRLYLLAGQRFLDGQPVYLAQPLTELLDRPELYPFLYPPPAIPLFAAAAALPFSVVAAAWVAASIAAIVVALRAVGVRWAWLPAIVAWPGVFVGLWAGNIAVPAFLLLALAVRAPAFLPLGPLVKLQLAVPALWLLRQRAWRAALVGGTIVAAAALVTLPLTGFDAWLDWWTGLRAFQMSQEAFPVLYALALPRLVPYPVFLALAIAAVVWALTARGRDGLAGLGLAAVVASPSLYRHGFLTALPQVLRLDAALVWLVLGAGLTLNPLWLGLVLAGAASLVQPLRRGDDDPLHPLGPSGLWPTPGTDRAVGTS